LSRWTPWGVTGPLVEQIVQKEADSVICLKGHQEALHEAAKAVFAGVEEGYAPGSPGPCVETFEEGHGRAEARRCWVSSQVQASARHEEWQGLRSFARVESERTVREKNETQAGLRSIIRPHWAVENDLHWSLLKPIPLVEAPPGLMPDGTTVPSGPWAVRAGDYLGEPAAASGSSSLAGSRHCTPSSPQSRTSTSTSEP